MQDVFLMQVLHGTSNLQRCHCNHMQVGATASRSGLGAEKPLQHTILQHPTSAGECCSQLLPQLMGYIIQDKGSFMNHVDHTTSPHDRLGSTERSLGAA